MHLTREEFERLVVKAISRLPTEAKLKTDNVAFIVEEEVREAKALELHLKRGQLLLGLYEGVNRANRGAGYFGVLPDKITIFQRPIEQLAGNDPGKLEEGVFDVVRHEVGHHLGFDEAGIRAHERLRKENEAL